ncbi:MAG: lipoate--protein ligase [Cryomorphaceae bacterium]|nr:lipoate--protein ligase [Cryomorphaceae bacterium]
MLCIQHSSTDPYFNIATDEFIFKHIDEDVFMLWQNDNAIIVGKHQNALAEINVEYVKKKGIHVVRRLSGGGAVYHDMGNLNFSFTHTGTDSSKMVDFRKYTQPIIDVLQSLGVEATFEGRNDLMIKGKKFSGNAEHVIGKKVLHHGTLLFSSEMRDISGALKINPLKYKDRAIKSVPKRVTNIVDHLGTPITLENFREKIMEHVLSRFENAKMYSFTENDLQRIQKIRDEKYATWDWNFGYSPKYDFSQGVRTKGGTIEVHLNADRGIITAVKILGDYFHLRPVEDFESQLVGCPHEENALREKLRKIEPEKYFKDIGVDDLLTTFF